jgi:hypothetical protein
MKGKGRAPQEADYVLLTKFVRAQTNALLLGSDECSTGSHVADCLPYILLHPPLLQRSRRFYEGPTSLRDFLENYPMVISIGAYLVHCGFRMEAEQLGYIVPYSRLLHYPDISYQCSCIDSLILSLVRRKPFSRSKQPNVHSSVTLASRSFMTSLSAIHLGQPPRATPSTVSRQ